MSGGNIVPPDLNVAKYHENEGLQIQNRELFKQVEDLKLNNQKMMEEQAIANKKIRQLEKENTKHDEEKIAFGELALENNSKEVRIEEQKEHRKIQISRKKTNDFLVNYMI